MKLRGVFSDKHIVHVERDKMEIAYDKMLTLLDLEFYFPNYDDEE